VFFQLSIENYAKEQEQIKKEQMHVDELQKEFTDGLKTTLETSGEDAKLHSKRVEKM
jgi:hypothetical protein